MSDSIIVRVTLDSAAILHPETRVYVQIPEVARTEYLLPAERYEGLRDRAWPEVLDVAQEHAERGWAVAAPAAAARAAVAEWLRDNVNRDEMQAAWELDQARRNPVAREWHSHIIARDAEIERLKARLAEYERPADATTSRTPAEGDRYVKRAAPDSGRVVTVTRVWAADDGHTAVAYSWRDDKPGECGSACNLDVFHRTYAAAGGDE